MQHSNNHSTNILSIHVKLRVDALRPNKTTCDPLQQYAAQKYDSKWITLLHTVPSATNSDLMTVKEHKQCSPLLKQQIKCCTQFGTIDILRWLFTVHVSLSALMPTIDLGFCTSRSISASSFFFLLSAFSLLFVFFIFLWSGIWDWTLTYNIAYNYVYIRMRVYCPTARRLTERDVKLAYIYIHRVFQKKVHKFCHII